MTPAPVAPMRKPGGLTGACCARAVAPIRDRVTRRDILPGAPRRDQAGVAGTTVGAEAAPSRADVHVFLPYPF